MIERVCITGSLNPSDEDLYWAEKYVVGVWTMQSCRWSILVPDDYGVAATVIATARKWDVPYTVVGLTRRPKFGSLAHYQRFLPPSAATSPWQRVEARNRYLVHLAEQVVCIGADRSVQAIARYAGRFTGKGVAVREDGVLTEARRYQVVH